MFSDLVSEGEKALQKVENHLDDEVLNNIENEELGKLEILEDNSSTWLTKVWGGIDPAKTNEDDSPANDKVKLPLVFAFAITVVGVELKMFDLRFCSLQ